MAVEQPQKELASHPGNALRTVDKTKRQQLACTRVLRAVHVHVHVHHTTLTCHDGAHERRVHTHAQ